MGHGFRRGREPLGHWGLGFTRTLTVAARPGQLGLGATGSGTPSSGGLAAAEEGGWPAGSSSSSSSSRSGGRAEVRLAPGATGLLVRSRAPRLTTRGQLAVAKLEECHRGRVQKGCLSLQECRQQGGVRPKGLRGKYL